MGVLQRYLRKHFQRAAADETPAINNPFKNKTLREVDDESEAFARKINENDPQLLQLFQLAGRITFNPPGWRDDIRPRLTERQNNALTNERKKGVFGQTKATRFTVLALWLSAMIQGWIQSTLSGTNLSWPADFNLPDDWNLWNQSITNGIVFFVASAACFFSDPLQSRWFGRRDILFSAAIICLAGAVGAACVNGPVKLLGCRVLLGVAMGMKASVTTIYAAEISPSHLRGTIVMGWQAGDTLGIFAGSTANLIVEKSIYGCNSSGTTDSCWETSWRWQTASLLLPSLALAVLIYTVPDSPRLYLRRGRYEEAFAAMCQLRETSLQAARDLFYANAQLQIESDHLLEDRDESIRNRDEISRMDWQIARYQSRVATLSWSRRVRRLLFSPRARRALQSACILMVAQQFAGFNLLAFFGSNFFGFDTTHDRDQRPDSGALWRSWGIGLANFVFTLPALWIIDYARVWLLLTTYPFMIIFMVAITSTFAAAGSSGVPATQITGLFFAFTFFYSLGLGPVPFTYSAEVFPLVYRESGMSIAVSTNLFFAGLLTLLAPQTQFLGPTSWTDCDVYKGEQRNHCFNIAQSKMWGVFAGLEVLSFILIFLFTPETAGCTPGHKDDLNYLSLEEINSIFEVPTLHHTWYRIRHVVPQAWHRLLWKLFGVKVNGRIPGKIVVVWRWPPNEVDRRKREESSESKAEIREVEEVSRESSGNTSSTEQPTSGVSARFQRQRSDDDPVRPAMDSNESPTSFRLPDLERGPSFRASNFERAFGDTSRTRSF